MARRRLLPDGVTLREALRQNGDRPRFACYCSILMPAFLMMVP